MSVNKADSLLANLLPDGDTPPQPAAPLGDREAIARIIGSFPTHDDDRGDENSVVHDAFSGDYDARTDGVYRLADAILAAIPQERGVERAAIIAECLEAAQIGFEESMSQYVLIGPGGIAMAMIDAIRVLAGKETGR